MSVTIHGPIAKGGIKLPLCSFRVTAGFPSPAADHIEQHISLDEILNIRAPNVYLISIAGDSMQGEREGCSYQEIKDEVRREMAFEQLRESKTSIGVIAEQLGFQEPSTFHRAFKKWTGKSPGKYRSKFQDRLQDRSEAVT